MAKKVEDFEGQWRVGEWFSDLGPDVLARLEKFQKELVRFNRGLNLISQGTIGKIDLVHISDAILGWRVLRKNFRDSRIFDFGSGNGIPGIVISVLEPGLSVVVVDSDGRKCEYLKHLTQALELKNARVLCQRVESLPKGEVKCAVVRGFASIPRTLSIIEPMYSSGDKIFHLKGPEWSTEIAAMSEATCSTWNNTHVGDYALPQTKILHSVILSSRY